MTPADTVSEVIARNCRKDLDAACEQVSADVEYDNVPMGKQYGPEGITALLGPMLRGGMEAVEWVIHRQAASGNVVMNERTDRFQLDGRWIELPVAGVFELDADGRISLW